MLAALFIALIGIASHMSIQVFFLCANLIPEAITSPLLTLHTGNENSLRLRSCTFSPMSSKYSPTLGCGAMRSFPLCFLMAMVDK